MLFFLCTIIQYRNLSLITIDIEFELVFAVRYRISLIKIQYRTLSRYLYLIIGFVVSLVAGTNQKHSRSTTVSTPWTRPRTISRVKRWCSTPWAAIFWTMRFRVTTPAFSLTAKPVGSLVYEGNDRIVVDKRESFINRKTKETVTRDSRILVGDIPRDLWCLLTQRIEIS